MSNKYIGRMFILGIDGVPYSFLTGKFNKGEMPVLARFCKKNAYKKMNSVYPTVSSVAWTSFSTGVNPAKHNIFGFVDREPNPFQIKIPTAQDRKAKTIWQELSRQGKKVIIMNVPLTYPPEEVNGILVSGFLCTDINKSSCPQEFSNYLKGKDYVIDVDAWLAKEDKRRLMDQLHQAMEKRFEIAFDLINKNKWDYFQLHIMETDRLFHFFWDDLEKGGQFSGDITKFFERLDGYIAELQHRLKEEDGLIILSDHGFCGVKYEVQLNKWLEEQELLKFENAGANLPNYSKDTICYSLLPGRIFINLEGREERGTVKRSGYKPVREDIKKRLTNLTDPDSGERLLDKIFFKEEIYTGPYIDNAADIIVHPKRGYDLKGKVGNIGIFDKTHINGMHTFDDAFICARGCDISGVRSIQDVRAATLRTMLEEKVRIGEMA